MMLDRAALDAWCGETNPHDPHDGVPFGSVVVRTCPGVHDRNADGPAMSEREALAALLRAHDDQEFPAEPDWYHEYAARLIAAGVRVAPSPDAPGLRDAAEAFLDHVAAAASWPTPGIGCDGEKCKEASALRAVLAAQSEEP